MRHGGWWMQTGRCWPRCQCILPPPPSQSASRTAHTHARTKKFMVTRGNAGNNKQRTKPSKAIRSNRKDPVCATWHQCTLKAFHIHTSTLYFYLPAAVPSSHTHTHTHTLSLSLSHTHTHILSHTYSRVGSGAPPSPATSLLPSLTLMNVSVVTSG